MKRERLLDTNVLILHLREEPGVMETLSRWAMEDTLYISVATRTEVLAGMRPHEEVRTLALLNALVNLPVDEAIADQAGRLIYQYARRGFQFSFPDAVIAATALRYDLVLVTTNVRHFPVPELEVEPFPK